MEIAFTKMHGAGNDFLVVDDRDLRFPSGDRDWIARIAARRTGVGSDGVLLVQPSEEADFRMRFFNPDGREADMCGNGARCIARFAREIGAAPDAMRIETGAGLLRAEISGEAVRLRMTEPRGWVLDGTLALDGRELRFAFVNTGVPHVVLETEDAAATDVEGLGRAIRRHERFAPGGANVNFAQPAGPARLKVRTYERGVEGETLACGTGIVASGLAMARLGRVRLPVTVETAGGDRLVVNAELGEGGAAGVTLTGPAVTVYRGALPYP